MFNRNRKQNLPSVKKVSELVNSQSHKQGKFISLMIVPSYSGSKTRSLRVPYAVFYGTVFAFIAVIMLIGGIYLSRIYFEQKAQSLSFSLEETIETFAEYRQSAEYTHISLRDNSLEVYNRLNDEQNRARQEFSRQERLHQDNFDDVMAHIYFMENQIREFETERVEFLDFLNERKTAIPPIASVVSRLETSQESLLEELSYNTQGRTVASSSRRVGLMGAGAQDSIDEDELRERVEILMEELHFQRLLFENLDSYKSQIDTYLRNFPTLMPIVGGRITSGFGNRRDPITGRTAFHEGVDIPAAANTPILAAGGGTVSFQGWRNGYGNVVDIDHGGGLITRYAHNTSNAVTVGQRVERGDVIAYVGRTGRAISNHLHYEVLRNGQQINPVPFITETAGDL
ncbi:MAG: M23 family metallopeptidase [Defluviitaleaceae bacterium]|nr:M23 family metallopeptidase [Defluviitaleaceae bacterium]